MENIIEVDQKFYKKHKVVTIPSLRGQYSNYNLCCCIKPMSDVLVGDFKIINRWMLDPEYWEVFDLYVLGEKIEDLDGISSKTPILFISINSTIKCLTTSQKRVKSPGSYYFIEATTNDLVSKRGSDNPSRFTLDLLQDYCENKDMREEVLIECRDNNDTTTTSNSKIICTRSFKKSFYTKEETMSIAKEYHRIVSFQGNRHGISYLESI